MEWLTGNWIWLVLGLGIAWFLFKGGMGCGRGRHGSHGAQGAPRSREIGTAHTGHAGEDTPEPEDAAASGRSRHRGC
jgi:hypothetical protein